MLNGRLADNRDDAVADTFTQQSWPTRSPIKASVASNVLKISVF